MSKSAKQAYHFLKEGYEIPKVRKRIKSVLDTSELLALQKMMDGDFSNEDMFHLYLKGYWITDICEAKGITKQRVSVIIKKERERLGISAEDAKERNKEARKKLQDLSAWYAGVYRADEQNSLDPVIDVMDKPKMATLPLLYQTYVNLGGTKIKMSEADVDKRRWNPNEDKVGAKAVNMYMEGRKGREIRAELGISSEELFVYYRRYLRLKAEQEKKAAVKDVESHEESPV